MSAPYLTEEDFLESFRLDALFQDSKTIQHHVYSDRRKGLRKKTKTKVWMRKKELGRGGFGIVHLEENESGIARAVKEVPKKIGNQTSIDPMRELIAMAALSKNETNFVKLEGWFQSDAHIYIVMEYFELGDLHRCVQRPIPETEAQDITAQLSEALHFMHQKNFTHRDLKPANVFVVTQSPRWWVKLADLGISKRVRSENTSLYTSFDGDFMAPEVLGFAIDPDIDHYTSAVDMWALGVLAHWLLTLNVPVPRRNFFVFCSGKQQLTFEEFRDRSISMDAVDFVQKLVRPNPKERLSSTDVLDHSWLSETFEKIGLQSSSGSSRSSLEQTRNERSTRKGKTGVRGDYRPVGSGAIVSSEVSWHQAVESLPRFPVRERDIPQKLSHASIDELEKDITSLLTDQSGTGISQYQGRPKAQASADNNNQASISSLQSSIPKLSNNNGYSSDDSMVYVRRQQVEMPPNDRNYQQRNMAPVTKTVAVQDMKRERTRSPQMSYVPLSPTTEVRRKSSPSGQKSYVPLLPTTEIVRERSPSGQKTYVHFSPTTEVRRKSSPSGQKSYVPLSPTTVVRRERSPSGQMVQVPSPSNLEVRRERSPSGQMIQVSSPPKLEVNPEMSRRTHSIYFPQSRKVVSPERSESPQVLRAPPSEHHVKQPVQSSSQSAERTRTNKGWRDRVREFYSTSKPKAEVVYLEGSSPSKKSKENLTGGESVNHSKQNIYSGSSLSAPLTNYNGGDYASITWDRVEGARYANQDYVPGTNPNPHRFRTYRHEQDNTLRQDLVTNNVGDKSTSFNEEQFALESKRLKDEQAAREEAKLREIEIKVQREIEEKRRELLARDAQLRDLEARMAREENKSQPNAYKTRENNTRTREIVTKRETDESKRLEEEQLALQSKRLKEEQLAREEAKLREIEIKVQREIDEKRKELLERETRLRELEARLREQNGIEDDVV